MANTKNYTEHGGSVTHIGGELVLDPGSKIIKDGQEIDIGGGVYMVTAEVNFDDMTASLTDASKVMLDAIEEKYALGEVVPVFFSAAIPEFNVITFFGAIKMAYMNGSLAGTISDEDGTYTISKSGETWTISIVESEA